MCIYRAVGLHARAGQADEVKAALEMAAAEIRAVHVNIKASVFLEVS